MPSDKKNSSFDQAVEEVDHNDTYLPKPHKQKADPLVS